VASPYPCVMNVTTGRQRPGWFMTGGVYGMLLVLGVVEGTIGSFQYSRTAGSVPLAAIAFCVGIGATCLLAAWGMRSVSGALMPAMGWVITSFVLSMPVSSGTVIITATTPGEWYLYGGTLCAAAAVALCFGSWVRGVGGPPRVGERLR
jgi:hypothetical protein